MVATILEAAAQVFEREGYDATTNRIAERAGVSVGSLYQYFPDKAALLTALADAHLAEAEAMLIEAFAELDGLDLHATLDRLARTVLDLHLERPLLHQLAFAVASHPPETVTRFATLVTTATTLLAAELRRLGVAGHDPDLRARLVVEGLAAQLHGVLLDPAAPTPHEVRLRTAVELWAAALTGSS